MALPDIAPHRRSNSVFTRETSCTEDSASRVLDAVTDDELMVGVGRGDEPSLRQLLQRHWKAIVGYACAFVDADSAEDVTQKTFLRVSANAERWRPLCPVRTYLLHIARNIALNERRQQRNRRSALDAAHWTLTRRSAPTPADRLDESELRDAIRRALDAMPDRRREVFALIRFGGLSYRETAAVMGTSEQTTANQMSAAMADLRRALEPLTDEP
jgi:RNA polymerase sigma-70 factor (ECF subfamily)